MRSVGDVAKDQFPGAIAFAPDGRIAVAPQFVWPTAEYRHLRLVDPRTKTERQLPFRIDFKTTLGMSDLMTGGAFQLDFSKIARLPDMVTALAFTPDSRWLFLGLRNGGVLRWQLDKTDDSSHSSGGPTSPSPVRFLRRFQMGLHRRQ